jgi:hypothetical protein
LEALQQQALVAIKRLRQGCDVGTSGCVSSCIDSALK